MSDVFISYSRKDIAFARVLYDALKAKGLNIWVDWEDIPPSADWLAEVYRAIEGADTLVFIVSQTSVHSEVCRREIEHGLRNHKRLVPILLHDIDPSALPLEIASLNWIFFREQDDFQQAFDKLVGAIQMDFGWIRAHTRLLVRAKEWDSKGRDNSFALRGRDLQEAEEWLGKSAAREPTPTPLQVEYILASRKAATSRQRATLALVTLGLVVTAVLALAAWNQRNEALEAKAIAVEEARVRATAQADAIQQRDNAEQQRRIALSRQLAAQARTYLSDQLDLSLLLAVEASRIADTIEAKASLLDALEYSPNLIAFLHGHTSYVFSVAFHPQGSMLASGSADGSIMLWDITHPESGARRLTGHTGAVNGVAFSPDGQLLASGSSDGSIILWDVGTGMPLLAPLKGHNHHVLCVAFSPDGQTLASGSDDQTVMLWDVATGEPLGSPLEPHWGMVREVAFSPDGRILAAGGYRTIVLWDVASRKPTVPRLEGHNHYVTCMAFSPDGKMLLSGGDADDAIMIWDISTGSKVGEIPLVGYTDGVFSLAFDVSGEVLATGSGHGAITMRDAHTYQVLDILLTGHPEGVPSVALSPDGATLAACSGNLIMLWGTQQTLSQPLARLVISQAGYTGSLAFSPDGKAFASGGKDYAIILWNPVTGQAVGQPLNGHKSSVTSLAFSPDGQMLASGSEDNTVMLWDVATQQPIGEPLTGHTRSVTGVAFSPDGRTLASCSADKTIILWDIATRQPLSEPLAGHSAEVLSLAFSPDGQTLASGSIDRTIILWDVATRRPRGQPLRGHSFWVNSVAFSPDGRILASGGGEGDCTVILWDVTTGQPILSPLEGHSVGVNSVAFSPDGRILASGSGRFAPPTEDNSVILWDVKSGHPIGRPLIGHSSAVDSVIFSPDGRTLVSGSLDGTIVLWDVSLEAWQARACCTANRNLTLKEWQQFVGDEPCQPTCPNLTDLCKTSAPAS